MYGEYDTKRKFYVSECNKKDKDLYDHPTIKPLNIIKNFIINSSKENDVVLDTFMGSGTTAVACKETNRNYLGFELNKEFYNITINRLNGISQIDKKIKGKGQLNIFDMLGTKND